MAHAYYGFGKASILGYHHAKNSRMVAIVWLLSIILFCSVIAQTQSLNYVIMASKPTTPRLVGMTLNLLDFC
jgi:hypothetical protein